MQTNGFFGGLPGEVFILPLLRELNINGNFLSGTLPPDLVFASQLEVFAATGNFFSNIPTEIGGLIALRLFEFGTNANLVGTIPTQIGLMQSLEILDVSNTFLTGTIPTELGLITSLRSANFGFTSLTGDMPAPVCQIASNPALFLDTLIVDCATTPPEVACDVPACCTSCAE